MGLLGILAAFFSQECETSQPKKSSELVMVLLNFLSHFHPLLAEPQLPRHKAA